MSQTGEIALTGSRSVSEWSAAITSAWQKSVMAIFEAGELLLEARNQLLPSEFKSLCKDQLPFGYGTAIKLMRIASNPILSKKSHVKQLPASWGTLYELSTLPAPELKKALESGVITPRTERKEIEALKPAAEEEEEPRVPEEKLPPTATPAADKTEERILQWILALGERQRLEFLCRVIGRSYETLKPRTQVRWRNKITALFTASISQAA